MRENARQTVFDDKASFIYAGLVNQARAVQGLVNKIATANQQGGPRSGPT